MYLHLLEERADELLAGLEHQLPPGERRRWAAMTDPGTRRRFAAARALCRHALSAVAGATGPWRLAVGPSGRPELSPNPHGLTFNLAHTDGLIACIVARGVRCGVDVERSPARTRAVALAGPRLAPPERAGLAAAPPEHRDKRFAECWVLKEAYAKALGAGLELPLDSFWLEPRRDGTATLHHPAAGARECALWRFALRRHGGHALAVAVRDPRALVIQQRLVSAGDLHAPQLQRKPPTHTGGTTP